jgi:hypothetical protein
MAEFNRRRFLGALQALVELLQEHENNDKWVDWFQNDHADYTAAQDQPGKAGRQMAVVEHVMSAFGGMSDFTAIKLKDAEADERMQNLSTQLWYAARGLQGVLLAEMQE